MLSLSLSLSLREHLPIQGMCGKYGVEFATKIIDIGTVFEQYGSKM